MWRFLVLVLASGALAGCTSSGTPAAPATTISSTVTVRPSSPPAPSAGPTRAVAAGSCPLVGTSFIHDTIGMRLGRLTVLKSGGRAVGCRFYALQGGSLHATEHLPGPEQPVVEVATWRYATATAAHNAFVLAARAGRNPQQTSLGRAGTGVCYQVAFYPKDHGTDWACGASVGALRVLVRTVDTTEALIAATVTRAVLRRV